MPEFDTNTTLSSSLNGHLWKRKSHEPHKETRKRRSTASASEAAEPEKRAKRRIVPKELRKRAGVSCDLCKTRRVKCVRPTTNSPDDTLPPCENCTRLQVACVSALPRKTRIYGSVESLSARYRVLEALVKVLLPGRNTDDTEQLMGIAVEHGIDVSAQDLVESSSSPPRPDQTGSFSKHSLAPSGIAMSASVDLPNVHTSSLRNGGEPQTLGAPLDLEPVHRASSSQNKPPSDGVIDVDFAHFSTTKRLVAPSENLYPSTQGVMSYLGPSSSFKFMVSLRRLLVDIGRKNSSQVPFPTGRESMAIEEQGLADVEADDDDVHVDVDGHEVGNDAAARCLASPISGQNTIIGPLGLDSRSVLTPGSAANSTRTRPDLRSEDRRSSFVQSTRDKLPTREVADALVEAFFDHVHPNYVIFHRGIFQLQYESLLASPDDLANEQDTHDGSINQLDAGWVCSIYMVFVFGHQALKSRQPDQAPILQQNYVKLVHGLLHQVLSSTSLSNVQALLLIQLYQHNSGERNASWILLGCACRMAVSMGMHRDGVRGGFGPIVRELRRRVWWTMFTFEKQLSLTLGRPSAIPEDGEVNVGLPNEGMMDGKTYMPPRLLGNMLSLTDILVKIRRSLFTATDATRVNSTSNPNSRSQILGADEDTTRLILTQLDDWFRELPSNHQLDWNANGSNHYRAAHLLHLMYYHARQVITRSFLLQKLEVELVIADHQDHQDKVPSVHANSKQDEYSDMCLSAALSSISVLESLWESNQVDGLAWLDIYWAYHSGILLLINLLHECRQAHTERQGICTDQSASKSRFALESKAAVRRLVKILQEVKLCKTMRVFANVTVQLAKVVGVSFKDVQDDANGVGCDPTSPYGLVTSHTAASDAGFNLSNVRSTGPAASTNDWLTALTDADFLFPLPEDGNAFDDFGWTHL